MFSEGQEVTYTGTKTYSLPMSSCLTHFISIALTKPTVVKKLDDYQKRVLAVLSKEEQNLVEINSPFRFHMNLGLICLNTEEKKSAAQDIMKRSEEFIKKTLAEKLVLGGLKAFDKQWPDGPYYRVYYVDILNCGILETVSDHIIRQMIDAKIIDEKDENAVRLSQIALNPETNLWSETNFFIRLFQARKTESVPDFEEKLMQFSGDNNESIEISSFDISTRREFDVDQYYKPFIRVNIAS